MLIRSESTSTGDIHMDHCSRCFNLAKCTRKHECHLVECLLNCGAVYHECKQDEHSLETCPMAIVPCLNQTNGCKLQVKRIDMSRHLNTCVANVVRCSAFRVRKIVNKREKYAQLKWPDPIHSERLNLLHSSAPVLVFCRDFNNNAQPWVIQIIKQTF